MKKNIISSIFVVFTVLFVSVPIWSTILFYGDTIKNKTTKKMLSLEKSLAEENGNAFLYLVKANKGVVWSYCAGDTNQLLIYTIDSGKVTNTKNIVYNKSIAWLDSINTDISEFLAICFMTLDPNSFTALLNHGKLKLGFRDRSSKDFPDMWVLRDYADSLGSERFYSNIVNSYEEGWSIKYEAFKDSIPKDHFFPNLARDIRDYVFPSASDKREAMN